MQAALRPWLTAGLALAGAGVIAAVPMAASMHDAQTPDVQLVNTADPFTAWGDLFTDSNASLGALTTQLPSLLQGDIPPGTPDGLTVLLPHAFDYPIHNLGDILESQFGQFQTDLTNPVALFSDLLSSPAVTLDAVLNGAGLEAADGGLRGLLNPIHIPTGVDGDTVSQLGTFSNLAAVLGDQIGGLGLPLAGDLDFGL